MAQATVTLSTTTLAAPLDASGRHATLSSLTGVIPGQTFLYIDKELAKVETITGISTVVVLSRGQDGTASTPHANGATVYLGRGDQFYMNDPQGAPANPIAVYPYINVVNGTRWGVTGDEDGPGVAARFWSPITDTPDFGPLGIRTTTTATPS